MNFSYWVESTKQTNFPSLAKDISTDVLIIGGGITGILTAYMLSNSNLNITIVEADKMAMGVTANTTAKITSQHGLLYDYLLNSFDFETAKGYLDSNEEAIKLVSQIVEKEKIDCDFSYQDSSYAIGVELNQDVFDGMYISCDFPSYSFRNAIQANGKKLLIVGGSVHKTGDSSCNIEDSYINLKNYIKSIYPKAKIKYKWMTEDCVSLDKIPYIGEFSNFLPNMYVATGYKKWGMTTSHVAAKIISDKILNSENPYEKIYTATRLKPIKNSKEFGNMLKQSAYSLAINKLTPPIISYSELTNDSGGVVNYNGKKLGIYKDKDGKKFAVLPYCKHLGCELSWNNLEKTWDCPCHGSRYDYTGKIITEPTTENLDTIDID